MNEENFIKFRGGYGIANSFMYKITYTHILCACEKNGEMRWTRERTRIKHFSANESCLQFVSTVKIPIFLSVFIVAVGVCGNGIIPGHTVAPHYCLFAIQVKHKQNMQTKHRLLTGKTVHWMALRTMAITAM